MERSPASRRTEPRARWSAAAPSQGLFRKRIAPAPPSSPASTGPIRGRAAGAIRAPRCAQKTAHLATTSSASRSSRSSAAAAWRGSGKKASASPRLRLGVHSLTMAGGKRLFSSIVVVGASLTGGCGGAIDSSVGRADPGGGATDGGGTSASDGGTPAAPDAGPRAPEDCADPAEFRCADYARLTGCRCDESVLLPAQCASQRLHCSCTVLGGNYGTEPCSPGTRRDRAMECTCADSGPLTEADCPSTAQFSCVDWIDPKTTCACDPTAPTRPEDCATDKYFQCHSLEPPVGCLCVTRIF